MKIFCFGFGFSARRLAQLILSAGGEIAGTWQSHLPLADPAIKYFRFGTDHDVSDSGLAELTASPCVLISIPPTAMPDNGIVDPVLARYRKALSHPNIRHIIYLSTTGVYGDHAGGWVDEETKPAPQTERGQRRLVAEQNWRDFCAERRQHGDAKLLTILRLAGIYGTGRSAIDSIRQGKAQIIIKPGQIFSRIHAADIAQFSHEIFKAGQTPHPPPYTVYNLCDHEPAPPQDVLYHAYDLLGLPPPAPIDFAQATLSSTLSPMQASFFSESKRVDNQRMRQFLSDHGGKKLLYPDFRAGLVAILQETRHQTG